jgi:hypothetical protein
MAMNLGSMNVVDLSHCYAPGSFMATVEFSMEGLNFVARKLKRTDSYKVDNFELYIKHESHWCEDFIDPKSPNLSRVDKRAVHLLLVAIADMPSETTERFNLLEM